MLKKKNRVPLKFRMQLCACNTERLQSVKLYSNFWRQNEKVKKIPKSLQTVLHFDKKMYRMCRTVFNSAVLQDTLPIGAASV